MQQLRMKQYESDEAREYADLFSVSNDLSFVLGATDRLLAEFNKPDNPQDTVIVRALWSAATIAYMRCFGSGKREGLQTEIFHALPDADTAHQHIKDTRDKHVAHSVNAFEEVMVGFVLGAAPDTSAEGVVNLLMFRICDDANGVRNLQILARHALDATRSQLESLKKRLLEIGQNMPRTELEKLPPLEIRVKGKPGTARP